MALDSNSRSVSGISACLAMRPMVKGAQQVRSKLYTDRSLVSSTVLPWYPKYQMVYKTLLSHLGVLSIVWMGCKKNVLLGGQLWQYRWAVPATNLPWPAEVSQHIRHRKHHALVTLGLLGTYSNSSGPNQWPSGVTSLLRSPSWKGCTYWNIQSKLS